MLKGKTMLKNKDVKINQNFKKDMNKLINSASGEAAVTATTTEEVILKKVNATMVENLLNGDCEEDCITLGGKYNRYTLNYDEISQDLSFEDEYDDCSGFGLILTDNLMNFKGYKTYVEIARCMTDDITEAFADKIIKDCGEYWIIAE